MMPMAKQPSALRCICYAVLAALCCAERTHAPVPRSDEPTNHLDSGAIRWLGNFLAKSGGTLVVVSHDEALLESVCDHIAEVRA